MYFRLHRNYFLHIKYFLHITPTLTQKKNLMINKSGKCCSVQLLTIIIFLTFIRHFDSSSLSQFFELQLNNKSNVIGQNSCQFNASTGMCTNYLIQPNTRGKHEYIFGCRYLKKILYLCIVALKLFRKPNRTKYKSFAIFWELKGAAAFCYIDAFRLYINREVLTI